MGSHSTKNYLNGLGQNRKPCEMASLKPGGGQSTSNVFKVVNEWCSEWIDLNLDTCLQDNNKTTK